MSTMVAPRTLTWGEARLSLIQDGLLDVPSAQMFHGLAPSVWAGALPNAGGGLVTVSVSVVVIQAAGTTILIDTGLGETRTGIRRGGGLRSALGALGLTPADITHVVISHAHGDHIWGAVRQAEGREVPAFPNARYHLPRADWEWLLRTPDNPSTRLLQPVVDADQLVLDAPEAQITPALRSVDTAGHSPGHRCLVFSAGGQTFCFLGDLTHHPPLHFAHPDWVTAWDSAPALTPAARRRLARRAVAEDWLLGAAHAPFPALGRLAPAGPESWTWRPVEA